MVFISLCKWWVEGRRGSVFHICFDLGKFFLSVCVPLLVCIDTPLGPNRILKGRFSGLPPVWHVFHRRIYDPSSPPSRRVLIVWRGLFAGVRGWESSFLSNMSGALIGIGLHLRVYTFPCHSVYFGAGILSRMGESSIRRILRP